ncbi:MAG: lytic transglycosylase domain-containing protein [Treponema sp.]|nr:lytic transglycosylase domain-containing protein [Treponema sp.]
MKLFETALNSSNAYIRQAAAAELASLEFSGTEPSPGTAMRIRREASGWWAAAFDVLAAEPNRKKVFDFLLGFRHGTGDPSEPRLFVMRELERQGNVFGERESAAIEGHFAVFNSRHNEALSFFRAFQENGIWPEKMPSFFLEYPVLINDLGRAFQYTPSGTEGLSLFLQWDKNLALDNLQLKIDNLDDLRYRLLFFAARIANRNRHNSAISLFEQALYVAPNSEQSDACVWYVLNLSSNETADFFIQHLEKFIPYWHNGNYFNDILERFLQTLASRHDWKRIMSVFNIIKDSGASIKAGYAWIIARTIEEGLLSQEERILAEGFGFSQPLALIQIAYNATENIVSSHLYYRSLCAAVLEQPFLELPEETADAGRGKTASAALDFLLGFFTHNAVGFVHSFIDQMERGLSPDELRTVARALEQAGMYAQSMRLVSRYIGREGYTRVREDMELLFPRAYAELVEKHAAETGIRPEIIFGLIRTESAFQNAVVSSAGAVGLTQLMPDTALEMAGRIRRAGGPDYAAWENGLDLSNPVQNIHIGVYYLNYLIARFEDNLLSLMAYNGGMNRVRRWRSASSLPVDLFLETVAFYETRDYGRRVIAAAEVYKELYPQ